MALKAEFREKLRTELPALIGTHSVEELARMYKTSASTIYRLSGAKQKKNESLIRNERAF